MRTIACSLLALVLLGGGIQAAPPTDQEKEAFLVVFKEALAKKDAKLLDPLLNTEGAGEDVLALSKKSQARMVQVLHPFADKITYEWMEPPAEGKQAMEMTVGNFHFLPVAEPVATLKAIVPAGDGGPGGAITMNLCLHDGKLMFIGMRREALPSTPTP